MRLFTVSVASSLLVLPGLSQSTLLEVEGPSPGAAMGYSVAGLPDLTGDGVPELVIGALGDSAFAENAGSVQVLSGADGSVVHRVDGFFAFDAFGRTVAALDDVDGDGVADFAGSARGGFTFDNRGYVRIHSGATGQEIITLTVGDNFWHDAIVTALEDLDGDERSEVLVTDFREPLFGGPGSARVYSGADGSLLYSYVGEGSFDRYGYSATGAGDQDGDGVPDFAISAPSADGGPDSSGVIYIYSGFDGSEIRRLVGTGQDEEIGESLDLMGDLDGDGLGDFVLANGQGEVVVMSALGDVIHRHAPFFFAWEPAVTSLDDVDGDGRPDYAYGVSTAPFGDGLPGAVFARSGATGNILYVAVGSPSQTLGESLDCIGDVNGDGLADLVAGGPGIGERAPGSLRIIASGTPTIARFCTSTPNSLGAPATIYAAGDSSVAGNGLTLTAGPIPNFQSALFFYGADEVQVPFGDGLRCVGGSTLYRLGPPILPSFRGVHRVVDLNAPPLDSGPGAALGATWKFQCWYRDTAGGGSGFNLSDAISIQFQP